jgi:hypothetical protein
MGGLISGLVSGGMDIGTSLEQGKADAEANELQLQRERRQANVAINSAMERGNFEAGKQRLLTSQFVAKQRQAYTASGVDASSGTTAAVQADTAALGEFDAQQISINAAREAWGYREQKTQAEENWGLNERNNNRKVTAGTLGGLSKGVAGIASLGGGGTYTGNGTKRG